MLNLFFTFLKIGLFSFGGGYGMLPLMLEECLKNNYLTESEFSQFLAVSESTPGPIAVNMATFIGSNEFGLLGSIVATLGVILPSIIIILLIVGLFKNFLKNKVISSALEGVKSVVCGLIIATGIFMIAKTWFVSVDNFNFTGFNLIKMLITIGLGVVAIAYKLITKKSISPILIILLSAVIGIIVL